MTKLTDERERETQSDRALTGDEDVGDRVVGERYNNIHGYF